MKTINKTALLILLKVFDVLGLIPVKTVLVGTEETIVLNCTCFKENNGNWKGPNRSQLFFKFNEAYLIQYAHGLHLNPKLEKTNVRVVGDYTKKTCSLLIEHFSTDNEGKYKCQYIENNITINQVYEILLTYPPSNMSILHIQDGNTIQAIEGKSLELICNVQSGRPVELMQWSTNGTVLKTGNKAITYRKIASKKDHMTTYTCSAFNSASKMPLTKHIHLDILAPIEVAINTTHFEDKINLQCHVSDDPGPYTLKDWEHKSESGKHIRYIENAQDGPIVLDKGNYQNSGIYICRVKNGIHDTKGQHHHGNQVVLHYEGPPVFLLNNNKTWFGQCCDEVIITLKVFNSSDITSEPTLKLTEQNDERHLSELIGSLLNSTCRDHLVFYNVSVNVPCIELEFNVKIMKGESRNYSAKLCNKFGCSFFDFTVISTDDGFKSTFLHDYCWITIGSLVGGILTICVCSHIYCYLKREKTCRRNIIEITLGDNYDEVEHLNYNNVIINNVNNDANMNNDNVSSIIENNDIILRVDVNSSDDSSSIKLSGDGYENPYQTFNLCDIDMHHYSSIVSGNYQNTIIFPPTLTAYTLDNSNNAADILKNPWLVIYKRKQ